MNQDRRHRTPEVLPKVFGIGLHKTSTTSLANALYTLGYLVNGFFDIAPFSDESDLRAHIIEQARSHDAVQDMPWPHYYQLLDREFPGSKFILTLRDEDRWIRSVMDHFDDEYIASHEQFYGVPIARGNEAIYRSRFNSHNQEVRDYFADRPGDLLIMDISAGDGWEVLGEFLGQQTPSWPFPRQNSRGMRRSEPVQRRARAVAHALVRKTHIDRLIPSLGVVDYLFAYAQTHAMCRAVDEVVAQLDVPGSEMSRGRSEGVLRMWLSDLRSWAVEAGAPMADSQMVVEALDDWQLTSAWIELRPSIRQWAADLTDDAGGIRDSAGQRANAAVTEILRMGDRYCTVLGLGIPRLAPA